MRRDSDFSENAFKWLKPLADRLKKSNEERFAMRDRNLDLDDFISEVLDLSDEYGFTLACEEGVFYVLDGKNPKWRKSLLEASLDE